MYLSERAFIERVRIPQWQLARHLNADERVPPYSGNTCNRDISRVQRSPARRSPGADAYGSAA